MSRTRRRIPSDRAPRRTTTPGARAKTPYLQTMPDGKRTFALEIRRDNHVTGLRSHRSDRRQARTVLRQDQDDNLPAGKMRRYSLKYGTYQW